MRSDAHARLKRLNRNLIGRIQRAEMQSLIGYCAVELTKLNMEGIVQSGLHSPLKQIFHVLGLMLGTSPNERTRQVSEKEWSRWKGWLNRIFEQYFYLFLPPNGETSRLTEEWWKIRDVAMQVFLHYFNTVPLAYEEQLAERIERWFGQFEDLIVTQTGLQVGRFLDIVRWIESEIQTDFDRIQELKGRFNKEVLDFGRQVVSNKWSSERARAEARNHPAERTASAIKEVLDQLFVINGERLEAAFSKREATSFFEYFVARPGDSPGYFYPTEENPAELRPLFALRDGRVFCPAPSALYYAALRRWYALLHSSRRGDAFLRHRDRELEERTRAALERFLGQESVRTWQNICETPDGQWEHDLLVDVDGTYLAVEAKAMPPKEPFRDPKRAYTRIRSDFRSDGGIQKAFEQANRLRKLLLNDGETILYDRAGNPVMSLSGPAHEVLCVCVTADSFGPLGVDLSLLLEKDPGEPYPWAVGIWDLETLLSGFSHLGKNRDDLLSYLRQRSSLHGLVVGTDELEVAGLFLQYGDFGRYMPTHDGRVILTPDLSEVFDEIYLKKFGVERKISGEVGDRPVMIDMTQVIGRLLSGRRRKLATAKKLKVGRNDPCPCRSGVKFKRCHGK